MPFSKHQVSPEHIEAMRSAFHKVCAVLQLDCKPGEPLTDVIVEKIIEHARAGETDPERLCSQVLIELAEWRPLGVRNKSQASAVCVRAGV
jgi:hypothetical protein